MNVKKYAKKYAKRFSLLCLLTFVLVPTSQAQIKHIEMRVEGMT
jgi:hypothetical protein